jgi:Domain of unknown function (DUF222)
VIHVLAEQATVDGTGDHPGYLQGFGILPAESVRELASTAQLKPLLIPFGRAGEGVPALGGVGGVRALARCHVPMARL